jgi:hypothetical protein
LAWLQFYLGKKKQINGKTFHSVDKQLHFNNEPPCSPGDGISTLQQQAVENNQVQGFFTIN